MEWRRFVTYLWNDPRISAHYKCVMMMMTMTGKLCSKFSEDRTVNNVTSFCRERSVKTLHVMAGIWQWGKLLPAENENVCWSRQRSEQFRLVRRRLSVLEPTPDKLPLDVAAVFDSARVDNTLQIWTNAAAKQITKINGHTPPSPLHVLPSGVIKIDWLIDWAAPRICNCLPITIRTPPSSDTLA